MEEVVQGYEEELGKLRRENNAFQQTSKSKQSGENSAANFISSYEEKIESLNRRNRDMGHRLNELTKKVGEQFSEDLLKEKKEGVHKDRQGGAGSKYQHLKAFESIAENKVTIAEVLRNYEEKLKCMEEAKPQLTDAMPTETARWNTGDAESIEKGSLDSRSPVVERLQQTTEQRQAYNEPFMATNENEYDAEIMEDLMKLTAEMTPQLEVPLHSYQRQGIQEKEIQQSKDKGNQSIDPVLTEQFIEASDRFDESCASPKSLRRMSEDFTPQYPEERDDNEIEPGEVVTQDQKGKIRDLEEKLQTETDLRERYEQDVQDLLQDIVNLKLKHTMEGEGDEDTREEIQKEHETKQENRLLKNELRSEKKRRASLEESKRELLYELDDVIRQKEKLEKNQKEKQEREKIAEELINLRKTLAQFKAKNKALANEVEELREKLKKVKEAFIDEKERLVQEKEKEHAAMRTELLMAKGEVELKLHEQLRLNSNLEDQVKVLEEKLEGLKMNSQVVNELAQEKVDVEEQNGYERLKNETLKEQLDDTERALEETIKKYQEQIIALETEKLKNEDELRHENELLRNKLHEELRLNGELQGQVKALEKTMEELKMTSQAESQLSEEKENAEEKNDYERLKNEALKEQLDDTERALKETIKKYQEQIIALETEKVKKEDELRHENELLGNKLELEKSFAEQQKNDLDEFLKREKERLKEEFDREIEREKTKAQRNMKNAIDDYTIRENKLRKEMKDLEGQFEKETKEMAAVFTEEKKRLQGTFDEELREKTEEDKKLLNETIKEMEIGFEKQREQMQIDFDEEKSDLRTVIEKELYEKLIKRNNEMEKEFQEMLSNVLKEHASEIEVVESEIKEAQERHLEETKKLLEQTEKEKKRITFSHQQEKKAYESTIQNLLKEIVKLKQQRKEMRLSYRKEQERMEEMFEREKSEQQEHWEKSKRELANKLKEEHTKALDDERCKFETNINELMEELKTSEASRKSLEDKLREEANKFEQLLCSKENGPSQIDKAADTAAKDMKDLKKTLQEEYEKRLKDEKRKFDESLQGLRREVGTLQEKRKLIQEKVYNQEASSEKQIIEKSIATYKKDVLSKLEEEFVQKIKREKRPLEDANTELRHENEELKQQRRELRTQLRQERIRIEEEIERERERLENQFVKEREQMKSRLESKIQKEQAKRTAVEKVNRALSPIALVSKLIDCLGIQMHCGQSGYSVDKWRLRRRFEPNCKLTIMDLQLEKILELFFTSIIS